MARWSILALAGVAVIGALAWMLLDAGETTVRIPYDDRRTVETGRSIYAAACASCHGPDLEGQPNWRRRGPNGRLPAPPHDETGHTWHNPDRLLFDLTKHGVARFAPPGYQSDMPGFSENLSDDEILAVLAFIKSTWLLAIQRRHDALSSAAQ